MLSKSKYIWHPVCHSQDSGHSRTVWSIITSWMAFWATYTPTHKPTQAYTQIHRKSRNFCSPWVWTFLNLHSFICKRQISSHWFAKHVYRPRWSGLEPTPQQEGWRTPICEPQYHFASCASSSSGLHTRGVLHIPTCKCRQESQTERLEKLDSNTSALISWIKSLTTLYPRFTSIK